MRTYLYVFELYYVTIFLYMYSTFITHYVPTGSNIHSESPYVSYTYTCSYYIYALPYTHRS